MKKHIVYLLAFFALNAHGENNIENVEVDGTTISWQHTGGWMQVQSSATYETVVGCQGSGISSCTVTLSDEHSYELSDEFKIIDHSSGTRATGIMLELVTVEPEPQDCAYSLDPDGDGAWHILQDTTNYESYCQTSNPAVACFVPPDTYKHSRYANGGHTFDIVTISCETSAYQVFDVAAAQAGFEVREFVGNDPTDSSGNLVTELTPGWQYRIVAPWVDSDGNYAGASGPIIFMDVDVGSEVFSQRDGSTNNNIYIYTAPNDSTSDEPVTFTWGKHDDSSQTTSQLASVTMQLNVTSSGHQVYGDATLSLNGSGTSVTATVQLLINAPMQVFWRELGSTAWIARTINESSSSYGASIPHVQSFSIPLGASVEVYATDHLGGTYQTAIETIENSSIDIDGFTSFLNVDGPDRARGSISNSILNSMVAPLSVYWADSAVNSSGLSTLTRSGKRALQVHVNPTPSGSSGSSRFAAGMDLRSFTEDEMWLSQYILHPAAHDFKDRGKVGVGLFMGDATASGGQPKSNGASVRIIWRVYNGQPAWGLYIYRGDQSAGTYGLELYDLDGSRTTDEAPYNQGSFNIIPTEQWTHHVSRVKLASSLTANDGVLQHWIDGVLVKDLDNVRWLTSGNNKFLSATAGNWYGGNQNYGDFAPNGPQDFFLADWKLKRN